MQRISELTPARDRFARLETEYKWIVEALAEEHTLLRTLIDTLPDYIFVKDRQSRFVISNMAHRRALGGITPKELVGKTDFDFFPLELATKYHADEQMVIQTGQPLINRKEATIDRQGRQQWFLTTKAPVRDRYGEIIGLVGICRDVTQHHQTEETMKMYQTQLEELVQERTARLKATNKQLQQEIRKRQRIEIALQDSLQEMAVAYEQALLYARDLRTEVAQSKNEREIRAELEQQLRQSQKMEAIGQLAGGVAHDFNNLLTAMMGYAGMALEALPSDHPARSDIQGIQTTVQRAANLTHQLVAFARQQIIEPRILNLNDLILDVEKLLRRLIGENIELQTWLASDLKLVKIDPNQLEQVLINLAINARDAMPDGGKLIIETANVILDDYDARRHAEVGAGAYILLTVSDTGTGMSEEVQRHLFEPFFTTKEVGKGTGLGLATCFGIIKQSDGHISVYSQPEQGTTFRIYLPRVVGKETDPLSGQNPLANLSRGIETILLVEDEPSVRDPAARVLRDQGYTVLEAANGIEALEISQNQAGQAIHLLVTDVVMPQMGGIELAERLKQVRSTLKVLFVSGYTNNIIAHHSLPKPSSAFLPKPFTPKLLVGKVREVLEAP